MNRLEDRAAIQDLIYRYAWALDSHDLETLGECFADECEFDSFPRTLTPDLPFPARGRADILALVHSAQQRWPLTRRRHVVTNELIDFLGDGRARARSYLTVVFTDPGAEPVVVLTGNYEDRLEFAPSHGWRFGRRVVHSDGLTAPGKSQYPR